jgi:3-methylfumaryl-CoA hydratase
MDTLEDYSAWVGREEKRSDTLAATPVAALNALLDRDDPPPAVGDAIPPLAHWLYFLPLHRQSAIGPDGHMSRGEFLPPVALPRRMWAGSRLEFLRPLAVGSEATRVSRIKEVRARQGRSGPLVFVTVRHEISAAGELAVVDEHDIVYRGETGKAVADAVPAPAEAAWRREIRPDPVLLFRYSAITLNGHRIHYDHPYTTHVEGYPGLIVHGPLIATLLVDLLRRHAPGARLRTFRFRALRPLFDTAPFMTLGSPDAAGGTARLWTRDAEGAMTMEAEAAYAG